MCGQQATFRGFHTEEETEAQRGNPLVWAHLHLSTGQRLWVQAFLVLPPPKGASLALQTFLLVLLT